jgi:hypothetical protein
MKRAFFALVALGIIAAPLSAQIVVRSGGEVSRTHDRIPPGQLPPRGMCRVWIDGVPPGQQPGVTDCVTAERNRVANSRVIYGDVQSFPGKGRGKFRTTSSRTVSRNCTMWDGVIVNGRVVNVCRDSDVRRDKTGRVIRRDRDDDDDDNRVFREHNRDDDDKFEGKNKSSMKVKANKGKHKGKGHDD